jgi:hypothetical protein
VEPLNFDETLLSGIKRYQLYVSISGLKNLVIFSKLSATYFASIQISKEDALDELDESILQLEAEEESDDDQNNLIEESGDDPDVIEPPPKRVFVPPLKNIATETTLSECCKMLEDACDYFKDINRGRDLYCCLGALLKSKRFAPRYLPKHFIKATVECAVSNSTIVKDSYIETTKHVFPPLWRALRAKDLAYVSFESYQKQRKCLGAETAMPPPHWIQSYQNILNQHAISDWCIMPLEKATHSVLQDGIAKNAPLLTNHKIVYVKLKAIIRSHILEAILAV